MIAGADRALGPLADAGLDGRRRRRAGRRQPGVRLAALAGVAARAGRLQRARPSHRPHQPLGADRRARGGPRWSARSGLCLAGDARATWSGLVGGALCLTPYAHAYDLAPLAPLAASWLSAARARLGPRRAGGALLAGLVATPAAALAFVAALAVLPTPRWRLPWLAATQRPRRSRRRPGGGAMKLDRPTHSAPPHRRSASSPSWSGAPSRPGHAHVKPADFYVFWAAARHCRGALRPGDHHRAAGRPAHHRRAGRSSTRRPSCCWPGRSRSCRWRSPTRSGPASPPPSSSTPPRTWCSPAWATLALFIAPPVVLAISPGQTSLLVGAAIDRRLALRWRSGRRSPALLFAIAACIKPQAMMLAPVVLWGHWRALRWAVIAGLRWCWRASCSARGSGCSGRTRWPTSATSRPPPTGSTRRRWPPARCSPQPARSLGLWLAWS